MLCTPQMVVAALVSSINPSIDKVGDQAASMLPSLLN
jgi:hypothetical protein